MSIDMSDLVLESKKFHKKYPHLAKIKDEYMLIRKYHDNKKSHMFNLSGNVEDLHYRHIPWKFYAAHLFSQLKQFAFVFIVRNSGEVFFGKTRAWKAEEQGLIFSPKKNDIMSSNQVFIQFKKEIIDKMDVVLPRISRIFQEGVDGAFCRTSTSELGNNPTFNNSFRIGNQIIPFLELIDNIIFGQFSPWSKKELKPANYGFPVLLIIENASTLFNQAMSHPNPKYDENYVFDLFNKWKNESAARSSLIIISEKEQTRIPHQIRESFTAIDISYPDYETIKEWIRFNAKQIEVTEKIDEENSRKISLETFLDKEKINELATNCKGLSLIEIEDMLVMLEPDEQKNIDTRKALERKKEIIRDRGSNLIEIFDDKIPLNHVILPQCQLDGIEKLIVRPIKRNRFDLAPRGILLMGPAGTGKTLLAKAIGSECGILVITLNLRHVMSKYVGESESQFRQVLALLKSLKPCLVIMDEIDQQMKGRTARNNEIDGGTSAALRGMLLEFMSDPHNREIIFVSMTNAPNELDYAQTRSGRNDIRILIGLPNQECREKLLKLHLKLQGIPEKLINANEYIINQLMDDRADGYSGADIALIAKEFKREYELSPDGTENFESILKDVASDLINSSRFGEKLTDDSLKLVSHFSLVPPELHPKLKSMRLKDSKEGYKSYFNAREKSFSR